ncbi:MAG: polyphenol oxidase family protein [Thermoanaerobaculia bacterium]
MRTPATGIAYNPRFVRWAIEETGIGRIVVPPLLPEGLALFYTTIDFEGGLDDVAVARLMRIVRDRFGVDAALSTCTQVHGKSVVRASREARWRECDSCDALWSSESGTALGIKVADCLPVTIADMEHGVIANIHSGWRGAVQKITAEALDVLGVATPFDPASAQAWLGPSIRICCFEVGEEVVEQFRASYAEAELFVDRGGAKPHIDLPGLTTALLAERGMLPDNVHDSGLCTRCDGSIFHSYRRKRGGRNLAIVAR